MHGVEPAAIVVIGSVVWTRVSCSSDAMAPTSFGRFGSLSGDSGRGSFRFGVATAPTQIEDMNDILVAFHQRYPDLPLVVTESGIATDVGARRAENVVRVLEAIARARDEGVDVRGYQHWSLTDNFEWSEGFGPHFGLYSVDYASSGRTITEGGDVLHAIASARQITGAQRQQYGGTGPMTREAGIQVDAFCAKVPAP